MAIVKAPLLSLGASGKFAKTLVGATWKGVKYMREYVIPSNPKTAAQVAHRAVFAAAVAAWRNYLTSTNTRTAWSLAARVSGKPQSGYNTALRPLIARLAVDPDASFAWAGTAHTLRRVRFTMRNMDDGAQGNEAGDFEVWRGDAPGSLLLLQDNASITAGFITTTPPGEIGDIVYLKLRKDSQDRSGIHKVTIIA